MSGNSGADYGDLSDFSLEALFRMEVETRTAEMTSSLLTLERTGGAASPEVFEELMRSAHSLKGAAGMVDHQPIGKIAHHMEDSFVAAQAGRLTLEGPLVDLLLEGVDLMSRLALASEAEVAAWNANGQPEADTFVRDLETRSKENPAVQAAALPVSPLPEKEAAPFPDSSPSIVSPPSEPSSPVAAEKSTPPSAAAEPTATSTDEAPASATAAPSAKAAESAGRSLRVTAGSLNRLLALTGESVVASRWVSGFAGELLKLKHRQQLLGQSLNQLRETLSAGPLDERMQSRLLEMQDRGADCVDLLTEQLEELDLFDRRFHNLSKRLYQEVIDSRMRPFSEGLQGLPRMVRDASRSLGKEVRLEITGESTPVDREVLERVEAPLGHLLRNAVDHAIEMPEDRLRAGKPAAGKVRVEARHSAGMLLIEVTDDGRGIDAELIRAAVARKNLTTPEVAAGMSEEELLEFLFLPGFSMKETVTQLSGRGVGLDVVHAMIREVGGAVRIFSEPGKGTRFQLELPITLSVLRTLLVEIGGEPYAFPLARITAVMRVPRAEIEFLGGREHFTFGGQQVGLVTAHQILSVSQIPSMPEEVPVILLGSKNTRYGVVPDRLLGERELVVLPLDPRLGKIKDISAAALMPDQSPVLIVDVEDMVRSIEILVSGGRLTQVQASGGMDSDRRRKRVLVVDDSLTVRELVRKFISQRGYEVETAVDGMDGWNAVRTGGYDLVVTDVDMPRMDGIELVSLIKKDNRLHRLPVMIVSYKDREEDRRRGLEAGADYYLTKSSFHDETLLHALQDLIGEAES
jgi:two-component system sensor histidine kinase and response regulator WspE